MLLFISCSHSQHCWQLESNEGNLAEYCSSKLYLSPEDCFSGLEIEFLNTPQGQHTYINTFGLELQQDSQNSEGYPVLIGSIEIDGETQKFTAFLLQGGHRILLPEEISCLIIQALHDNKTVKISVAHCSASIIPNNFVDCYQKIAK